MSAPRLLLLRHAEIASHRGDQPLTGPGREQAAAAGRRLRGLGLGRVQVRSGATRRTVQTARLLADALDAAEPVETFALRNPDLYLAGDRVDLVSTPDAFAAQVPGLAAADVLAVPFFSDLLGAPDRIGWWLHHPDPPGEGAAGVAARIAAFARSLGDRAAQVPDTVVAVTHSPVLRAVALGLLGSDPGEPAYLCGLALDFATGALQAAPFPTGSR